MASVPVTVFFSYSHKDEALRDELAKHLESLKWSGEITDWHDRRILPGDEWDRDIKENLNTAQIILLLISSDFIASPYCRDIEIERAMERHQSGEAVVIPVILRYCLWSSTPFGRLQALPKDAIPVTDTETWSSRDKAFKDVVQGIRKAANQIQQKLEIATQQKSEKYEAAYRKALQQPYSLSEAAQRQLSALQASLGLSETNTASAAIRFSTEFGEEQQRLEEYRHEVRLCLQEGEGKISAVSRTVLNGVCLNLGLSPEEALTIEQDELKIYLAKSEACSQYTQVLADTLRHENPPTETTLQLLGRFQVRLGLTDKDVERIKAEALALHPLDSLLAQNISQGNGDFMNPPITSAQAQALIPSEISDRLAQDAHSSVPSVQVPLLSERQVDYSQLRDFLQAKDWQAANQETERVMLRVARRIKEGWLHSDSIRHFPETDLRTIDRLWLAFSQEHFGFSVQRKIFANVQKQEQSFLKHVAWETAALFGGMPFSSSALKSLQFTMMAPKGHLPFVFGGEHGWILERLVGGSSLP